MSTNLPQEVVDQVLRGIKVLDKHAIKKWRPKIIVPKIRIHSHTLHPLGQVYGQYRVGIAELPPKYRYDPYEYGLDHPSNWGCAPDGAYFKRLEGSWIYVLSDGKLS